MKLGCKNYMFNFFKSFNFNPEKAQVGNFSMIVKTSRRFVSSSIPHSGRDKDTGINILHFLYSAVILCLEDVINYNKRKEELFLRFLKLLKLSQNTDWACVLCYRKWLVVLDKIIPQLLKV